MDKDAQVTFRLPKSVRDALDRAAEEGRRSTSDLARIIITDWLEAGGHLKRPSKSRRG
jgi:Arc/MetJ-type ribon-helix-helix transcriptional regulator